MTEWDQADARSAPELKYNFFDDDPSLRRVVGALAHRITVRELRNGLELVSNSYVGCVDIGPLRIRIKPKLAGLPLARLLSYAYGLHDLGTFDTTFANVEDLGIHDLLIVMLGKETERLLRRGLDQRYIGRNENLVSPRGQLLVSEYIRRGGAIDATLPCRRFDRSTNWSLNQVLLGGLQAAAAIADSQEVRRYVQHQYPSFSGIQVPSRISLREVEAAESGLTRVTEPAGAALRIITLLLQDQGLGSDSDRSAEMSGHLFDMNMFFQRLLCRFLDDHLTRYAVKDEVPIRTLFAFAKGANPRSRRTPTPRPDLAIYQDENLVGFFDAKYRDLWKLSLPPEWLYQLSIYAIPSKAKTSVLLYATMATDGRDERIEIKDPSTGGNLATVVIRPVPLTEMAAAISKRDDGCSARALASRLISNIH
ncbi:MULTISPECIES: McrC family protein [unclassified Polaromonas]|uniref:McrC family protein n=1 Tax=unclassified Polaromonas TaxID=2638319 RepID=UPI0013DDF6FD|nr:MULTISPECIES: hypothetical protein [unclassified Polaromonas]